jgi:hypothetical protein
MTVRSTQPENCAGYYGTNEKAIVRTTERNWQFKCGGIETAGDKRSARDEMRGRRARTVFDTHSVRNVRGLKTEVMQFHVTTASRS